MQRPLALATFLLLALPGCFDTAFGGDAVHQTVHEHFAVAPDAQVTVRNVSGFISVSVWSRPEIDILARKHGDDLNSLHRTSIEITHNGSPADTVDVRTHYLHDGLLFWGGDGASVDYTIRVPKDVVLNIEDVSGDIRVADIRGNVHISDVSGTVDVHHVGGNLWAHTVSGSINASMLTMRDDRNADIAAVSGSIELSIPDTSDASVYAKSISGDFESAFNVPTQQRTVGVEAAGRIGNGSGTINMSTVSGSMTLSKLTPSS